MATNVRRIKVPAGILQLHIELRGMKPKVWRRVLVPETITLVKLHAVIQAAFGWTHSHLHEFVAQDGERYGTADPMYDDPGSVTSERVRLTTALRTTRTLTYVYDFGDNWEHRIKVEKAYGPDPHFKLPFCVDGAGATPPEDCGGEPGYEDFVQAMADPHHSEHDSMVQWIGRDTWDPAAFDSIEVNDRLGTIKL
jgi:hypothetical protein